METPRGLLDCYLNKVLYDTCKYYKGTFCCDEIPLHISKLNKASVIVNLSPSTSIGSHFITIILTPKYVQYIDSLGFACHNEFIINFMNRCNRFIKNNSVQVQSFTSSYCGFYCMALCLYHEKERDAELTYYSTGLHRNDSLVLWYISNMINELKINKK